MRALNFMNSRHNLKFLCCKNNYAYVNYIFRFNRAYMRLLFFEIIIYYLIQKHKKKRI